MAWICSETFLPRVLEANLHVRMMLELDHRCRCTPLIPAQSPGRRNHDAICVLDVVVRGEVRRRQ